MDTRDAPDSPILVTLALVAVLMGGHDGLGAHVVFHQLQLTMCAAIARRLAAGVREPAGRVPG